ncbi:MAG: Asp23/Gls24 family envelope stress response protein [Veillonellaceae bacterium]|nr:Asp23/Gls24 family envelope stress response protein [Veillonellaceae bacterium]
MVNEKELVSATAKVSDEALLTITMHTLANFPAIHSMSSRFYESVVEGLVHRFGSKRYPGLNIKHKKECIEINIYINIWYGSQLESLTELIRNQVRQDIHNRTGLRNIRVDIHYEDIFVHKEKDNEITKK